MRAALSRLIFGKGQCFSAQITLNQLVNQPQLMGFSSTYGDTRGHHGQGFFYANNTGQSLGATGARQQAQIHFRQTKLGTAHRNPVVTAQRGF